MTNKINLGNIIKLEYGKGLPSSKRNNNGNIPVYGSNGVVGFHNEGYVNRGVVVGRKGSIGKTELVNSEFWPIDTTYYITERSNYDLKWIYYLLQTLNLSNLNRATGVPGLNRDDVYKIKVYFPDIKTQIKIGVIIATIDEAIDKTDQIIQKTERLKKGLMNKLLTKGIGHKKFKKTKLGEIPEEWEIKEIKQVSLKVSVGFVGACERYYTDTSGIRMIRTGNLKNGILDLSELKYVTKNFDALNQKSQVFPGDILIARHGNIGQAVLVPNNIDHANCLNVVIIRADRKQIFAEFLAYLINSTIVKKQITSKAGGSTQSVINTGEIAKIHVSLPPLSEQRSIVNILKLIDKKNNTDKEIKNYYFKLKSGLMQNIFSQKIRVN